MNKFCHSIIPLCFMIFQSFNFDSFHGHYRALGPSFAVIVMPLKEINFTEAKRTSQKPELESCLMPYAAHSKHLF